jgi:histidinol-phosphatase (PHP family)
MKKNQPQRVSVHGGHSGQFCNHARDLLEEIILAYIARRFAWVGITEHMPPAHDDFLFPDEKRAGETVASLHKRFETYMETGRRLQARYRDRITIYVGMETEVYPGSLQLASQIQQTLKPDYLVGSVHHVAGFAFDYDSETYTAARHALGGWEGFYNHYFDSQYQLIETLRPRVIGHFDLIRIYDPDYSAHLALPSVEKRIIRNLKLIRTQGAILDYNLRALTKGAPEPYVSRPILKIALDMKIPVVPGDDSHSVDSVGNEIDQGIQILSDFGFDTQWPVPTRPHPGREG